MKRFIFLCTIAPAFLLYTSCKKDKKSEAAEEAPAPVVPAYTSYSPSKIDNYWIYEIFAVNANGSYTSQNKFDSCYVEKDTVIGKYTYSKIRKQDFQFSSIKFILQRDSLHYLVSPNGILFSSEDFTTVFHKAYDIAPSGDTITKVTAKMDDRDMKITTPAGTFVTSNMKTTFITSTAYATPGVTNPRSMNRRFAKNIGLITETEAFYSSSNITLERRLIRYHLN